MSHWNYRVMKRENDAGEFEFGIYEVYYDDDGRVQGWKADSMVPVCASEEDLEYELNLMLIALKKETLIYKED
jgi:hypothetical protein